MDFQFFPIHPEGQVDGHDASGAAFAHCPTPNHWESLSVGLPGFIQPANLAVQGRPSIRGSRSRDRGVAGRVSARGEYMADISGYPLARLSPKSRTFPPVGDVREQDSPVSAQGAVRRGPAFGAAASPAVGSFRPAVGHAEFRCGLMVTGQHFPTDPRGEMPPVVTVAGIIPRRRDRRFALAT